MITYDPSAPLQLTVPSEQTDAVLTALSEGSTDLGLDEVDADTRGLMRAALTGIRASLRVEIRGEALALDHEFLAAEAGVVRTTGVTPGTDEIAVSPTALLPGLLALTAQIAPVEPLDQSVSLTISQRVLDDVFSPGEATRDRGLRELAESAQQLPAAQDDLFETAPVRAIRVTRAAVGGDRVVRLLQLRGRYLLVGTSSFGTTATGTDPTGASRAIFSLLTPSAR